MTFDPQIGDRCHWILWTDVDPCTVVARTPKSVTVRIDQGEIETPPVMVPGGFAAVVVEPATWRIAENPDGRKLTFTLRKDGRWKLRGSASREAGCVLRPGWRKYHDYSF